MVKYVCRAPTQTNIRFCHTVRHVNPQIFVSFIVTKSHRGLFDELNYLLQPPIRKIDCVLPLSRVPIPTLRLSIVITSVVIFHSILVSVYSWLIRVCSSGGLAEDGGEGDRQEEEDLKYVCHVCIQT